MMKRFVFALGLGMSVLGAQGALAHTAQHGPLQIIHPWMAPVERGATAVIKPTISNTSEKQVAIVKATSPAAKEIKLMLNGEVADAITIPPGGTLTPEEVQLSLRELQVDLPEGKGVPVTLRTRSGEELKIIAAIGEDTMDPQEIVSAH